MFQILLLLTVSLASAKSKMESFIVGGRETSIKLWPFITFIEAVKDNAPVSACGGSLISSQTVLTAAHCLDDVTGSKLLMNRIRFTIYMGHSMFKQATMSRDVIDYETHRAYNPYDDEVICDIGVMFLERPVNFLADVKKVILKRTFDITKDIYLEVAGWGKTDPNSDSVSSSISQKLKSAGITPMSPKKCHDIINSLVPKVICAAVSHEYAYSGDSGGPLVDEHMHYQLGVVSFRDEHTGITVYTSVPEYFNWIKDTQLKLFMKNCPQKKQRKLRDDAEENLVFL